MAGKESRTFEMLLDEMTIKNSSIVKDGNHLVTIELICPRPLVASKTATRTYRFSHGKLDCTAMPWAKRIYFKETVEFRFGICVRLSESVSQTYISNFLRHFAGAAFGVAADAAEDALPGPGGNIAAIPLDYAKKKLITANAPKIVAEGVIDLMPSELEDECVVELPMYALQNFFSMRKTGIHGDTPVRKRKLTCAEGTVIGTVKVRLNALKIH